MIQFRGGFISGQTRDMFKKPEIESQESQKSQKKSKKWKCQRIEKGSGPCGSFIGGPYSFVLVGWF